MSASYTSASISMPGKLFNKNTIDTVRNKIGPIHIQLSPTNKCNLKCPFCSCEGRNKTAELEPYKIAEFYDRYKSTIRATTITGGGEPLMHPDLDEIIEICDVYGDVGMVSNGYLLNKAPDNLDRLIWLRVSASRYMNADSLFYNINSAMSRFKSIDWAISFVCSDDALGDQNALQSILDNVPINKLTHIRVVSDILSANDTSLNYLKTLPEFKDPKIIMQPRSSYTTGAKNCYVSLIKPSIDATGKIYGCCGIQYSIKGKERTLPEETVIGNIEDDELWDMFDGRVCDRCFYDGYNKTVEAIKTEYKHHNFI